MHRTISLGVAASMDNPDTVFVYIKEEAPEQRTAVRKDAPHAPQVQRVRSQHSASRRSFENFRFNPNTASQQELQRLGFTEKQAQSIINYREKGGRFRRPEDFARSYVVADSVFERLAPYIDIPKLDINTADSAAFDALPGIGPWFASTMVSYREELGGYNSTEQLMDIYRFDEAKYKAIEDLICCEGGPVLKLWTMGEDSLRLHPAIRKRQTARSIVVYRKSMPREKWTVEELRAAGILDSLQYLRLSRCRIAPPTCGDGGSGSTPAR